MSRNRKTRYSGFTLLELSIVLTIIGLIIGGVLTGQNLINNSTVNAQIAQINQYNTAVGTFRTKYNGLPGDLVDPYATNYGFQPRGTYAGQGDGNGVLQGNCNNTTASGMQQGCGELAVFWQDLSSAGLINLSVKSGVSYPQTGFYYPGISINPWPNITATSTPSLSGWAPTAKLGNSQYVIITSFSSTNYFVVQKLFQIGWDAETTGVLGTPGNAMTVQQAYNIDSKMDDGMPQSGNVIACESDYDANTNFPSWAAGGGATGASGGNPCLPTTAAILYAATNCFDNSNVAGPQKYSVAKNATMQNCALSFRMQQ